MKKIIILLSVTILIVTALSAHEIGMGMKEHNGNHQMGRGMNHQGNHEGIMMEELDLTEDQQNQLQELRTEHQKEMIRLRSEIETLKIDKRNAMQNNNYSAAKKVVKQISAVQEELKLERINQKEAIWNLLTPEQREKLEELRKDHDKNQQREMKHQEKRERFNQ